MKIPELDTKRLKAEMERINARPGWLAKKLQMHPSIVNYIFRKKPVSYAIRLSKIFGINYKDLIK